MESKKKCWLTRVGQVLGILVILVPLFTSMVRMTDLTTNTAQTVEAMGVKLDHEVEARKVEDALIREAMGSRDKQTQAELSQIRIDLAVIATDIKYIVKTIDREKE